MKTFNFPYIAFSLGLFLGLILIKGSVLDTNGATTLPLLTLLIISEFAFFVTAIACYIGIRHIQSIGIKNGYSLVTLACFIMSITFMISGIALWPL